MGRYLVRRLLLAAMTIWAIGSCLFLGLRHFPGAPFAEDSSLHPSVRQSLEEKFQPNQNELSAYLLYWKNVTTGELGVSLNSGNRSVFSILRQKFRATIWLSSGALILTILLGLILGLLPHLNSKASFVIIQSQSVGLSLPTLFLGPLLLWVLCFQFELLPLRFDGSLSSYWLPLALLSFRPSLLLSQLLSQNLKQTLGLNHIRTMKSMGVSNSRLVLKWALKNSAPLFLAGLPSLGAGILSGSLLIETLFSIQGLGSLMVQSLLDRDWMLISGLVFLFAVLLIVLQIIVDALLMILDPRIRIQ